MTSDQTFVIVGAGLAGAKAAETLREEGFDGRLVLVGAEDERPYERPPLSKDYLRGEAGREKVYVHDEALLRRARHRAAARARPRSALDTSAARAGARRRRAAALRPAAARHRRRAAPADDPGQRARRRPVPAQRRGLRRPARAAGPRRHGGRRRRRLDRREVAASARQRGLEVTVIEPAAVPLERVLGAEVGAIYRDIHTDHGVRDAARHRRRGVRGRDGGRARPHQRRRTLECDFVVVGVGVRAAHRARRRRPASPSTTASSSTSTCRPARRACSPPATSPTPTTRFYGERIRVEHWANALHQGPAAARSDARPATTSTTACRTSSPTSTTSAWSTRATRAPGTGSSSAAIRRRREFIAFWLREDRVVAGMNVNVWDVTDPIQRLIRERGGRRRPPPRRPRRAARGDSLPRRSDGSALMNRL